MIKLSLVFNNDLKITWSSNESLVNKSLLDIFEHGRELTSLTRRVLSTKSLDVREKYTFQKDFYNGEKVLLKLQSLGEFYSLSVERSDEEKYIAKILWDSFAKTFPGGLLFMNKDFKVVEVTNSLLEILKIKNKDGISLSKASVLGRDLSSLYPDNEHLYNSIQKNLEKAVLAKRTLTSDYLTNHNSLRVSYGPVFEGEKVIGYCLYVTDITKEVKDKRLIETQQAKLFHSSKLASLGEMAGGIAHEINNPLAILSGRIDITLARLIKGKLTDSILEEDLHQMKKTTTRIAKIIQGMRVISRDGSAEDLRPCKVQDLFDDVLALSQEKCRNKGIALKLDIAPHLNHQVKCRRVQISQVLLNLLNNSMDAISKQKLPEIELHSTVENNQIQFTVKDNGPGIPKDLENKIFQPFFTTKEVGKGTGLGLSISAKIIEEHGDKLLLLNKSNGAIFSFRLPLCGDEL